MIRIRRGIDPDIVVRLPDGHHAAIAMSYTDYAAPEQSTLISTTDHLLDFLGLCQAAQLIEHIRQTECHFLNTGVQTTDSSEE